MGGDSGPSGPTAEQTEQLAQQKAQLRKKQQEIANKQVANLRAASSEGSLLSGLGPKLLSKPRPKPLTREQLRIKTLTDPFNKGSLF